MPSTTHGLPYPAGSSPTNVPGDMGALAAAVDTIVTPVLDAWTTYVPTWTGGGGNPAIVNGTIVGKYRQVGKTVEFSVRIVAGSSTTYGSGQYSISLPVNAATTDVSFNGWYFDTSAPGRYDVRAVANTASAVSLWIEATTAGNAMRSLSATTPVTLAVGDTITISGTYEAA